MTYDAEKHDSHIYLLAPLHFLAHSWRRTWAEMFKSTGENKTLALFSWHIKGVFLSCLLWIWACQFHRETFTWSFFISFSPSRTAWGSTLFNLFSNKRTRGFIFVFAFLVSHRNSRMASGSGKLLSEYWMQLGKK